MKNLDLLFLHVEYTSDVQHLAQKSLGVSKTNWTARCCLLGWSNECVSEMETEKKEHFFIFNAKTDCQLMFDHLMTFIQISAGPDCLEPTYIIAFRCCKGMWTSLKATQRTVKEEGYKVWVHHHINTQLNDAQLACLLRKYITNTGAFLTL